MRPCDSHHRGTAMGIKTALGGGLMSLIPLVAAGLIAAFGWRTTFAILGVSVWLATGVTDATAPVLAPTVA